MMFSNISDYNVIYNSQGTSDRSAMPLGNGEFCINVWCQNNNTIFLYLSRSDAITELDRVVKLGMLKITFGKELFKDNFKQELDLKNGRIVIKTDLGKLFLFVSKKTDTLFLNAKMTEKLNIKTHYITWRTDNNLASEDNGHIYETADIVENKDNEIKFWHKNGKNSINFLAKLQGVEEHLKDIPDLLSNRIFGGILSVENGVIINKNIEVNTDLFQLKLTTISGQFDSLNKFKNTLDEYHAKSDKYDNAYKITKKWWNSYWNKSYIYIDGDINRECSVTENIFEIEKECQEYEIKATSKVSIAYNLTKFMMACCSDGNLPILYNGMLFNLMPGANEHFDVNNFGRCFTAKPSMPITLQNNPDERSWCIENLWQNVRHPYLSMLSRGEKDELKRLIDYYKKFEPINKARASLYHGAEGQHNTEMTLSCGLQTAQIYGTDRSNLPIGYSKNRHGGAVDVSPGLELVMLMLDYYDYTKDKDFLNNDVIPYVYDLLKYIETRFYKRKGGKIIIGPLQSVETYWDTINPITVISGLKAVTARVSQLNVINNEIKDYITKYINKVSDFSYSVINDKRILMPAQEFTDFRNNVEPPQMYAIMPFKVFGIGKDGYETILNTFEYCINEYDINKPFKIGQTPSEPSYSGWQYISVCAALLGLNDQAGKMLEHNCALKNPGTRFPAMWGPIYDAVPDTDHGANILNTLQNMVVQTEDDVVRVIPSLPTSWNVKFKLHIDCTTTIECDYKKGEIRNLKIFPKLVNKKILINRNMK